MGGVYKLGWNKNVACFFLGGVVVGRLVIAWGLVI